MAILFFFFNVIHSHASANLLFETSEGLGKYL